MAGVTVTFWADHDLIHLTIADVRVKTIRSHLVRDSRPIWGAYRGALPAGV